MKILISCFLLLSTALHTYAQPAKGTGSSDPNAKAILDGVTNKFKTYKTVQAGFSIRIENASGRAMGNKVGNVYMKGNKFKVLVTDQEIYSDGSSVWTYVNSDNEVTISRIDPNSKTMTPQKLFSNFYDKDFLYKLNGNATINGKNVQEIELTPTDKSKSFFKILLYVDRQNIVSTKVFEKNGNRYIYTVSNMQTNKTMSDATFIFNSNLHPGIEVTDLR